MLEAGSNPRLRNKARLTPLQLVDPSNKDLRDLIQQHEYASQNAGDFVSVGAGPPASSNKSHGAPNAPAPPVPADDSDDDAEFSGSDDDERAEWERRRKDRGQRI